jgi:hypothetical protein
MLDRLVGEQPAPERSGPSRPCYDPLAGPLGVSLYRGLLARGALASEADGTVSVLDPQPLAELGVGAVEPGRRRLAFECLDATEHAAHLAGALGDALAASLLERGWVERVGSGREVRVSPTGARGLEQALPGWSAASRVPTAIRPSA